MASRHSAARPRRDGEQYAREHHNESHDAGSSSDQVRFDVRNPSKLAPEMREDDAFLDADVIGGSGATKRGAVNIDGYDSDSDNETFDARAQERKRGKVDILEQLDNYDARGDGAPTQADKGKGKAAADDDDDDDDMFAASDDDKETKPAEAAGQDGEGKKKKKVRYLDEEQIKGEEDYSRAGSRGNLDEDESSDDEEDVALAVEEEGVDEEVGAGGLRRNAPKVEAFNLRAEMEEGRFDQDGNFIRRAGDPDAVHDTWLDGTSKKEIRRAAEAHRRREAEARRQRIDEDGVLVPELLRDLILQLERTETPLEALARLGRSQNKNKPKAKKVPAWKLKKMRGGMDVDNENGNKTGDASAAAAAEPEDLEQARIKASIRAITEAADGLLSRDHEDVYDQEREVLVRAYQRETGEEWVEPRTHNDDDDGGASGGNDAQWEFRWTDGRDGGGVQGPFDGPTMKAWQEAGYFAAGGVEFRRTHDDDWRQEASFA